MNNAVPPSKPSAVESVQTRLKRRFSKFVRLLKYFILSSIILTILEIGVAYWLISSRWHLLLTKEQMIQLASEVNKAEPLPENFMRVYTANFPRHVNTTLTQQVFINYSTRFLLRHTDLDKKPHCFCDMVYDIQKKKHRELEEIEWDGRLQDLEYGFGVEKYSTPSKCFYYVARYRIEELRNRLNPNQYGHLLNKPIEAFNDDELIELILMLKTKANYTRYRNRDKYEKAFVEYKAKLMRTSASKP